MVRSRSIRFLTILGAVALLAMPWAGGASASPAHASLKVTIFAGWQSEEKADFLAIAKYCDTHYHTQVNYTQSSGSYDTELQTKVQGGNPPDVFTLSTPASIAQYAAGGSLKPVSFVETSKFKSQYSPFWQNLGKVNGKLYAIFMKSDVKSLMWYSPKKFKAQAHSFGTKKKAGGYQIPTTWAQLVATSNKMIRTGKQPWTFGASDGWSLTDLFENVYLQQAGVSNYNKLIAHKIKWTDKSVVAAFKAMNQIVGNDSMIAGGRARALSQKVAQGATQLITDPKAEFFQEATFIPALVKGALPSAKLGSDYSAFPFPSLRSYSTQPIEVGPNGIVMSRDTPGTRALLKCLVDPNALAQWARKGGYISPNNATPLSVYPNSVLRNAAQAQIKAGKANLLVGDASDLEKPALNTYEQTALQKWFKTPSSYMSVLQDMEKEAVKDYK